MKIPMGQVGQKIVLVVGAGAGVEYGFPTGIGLLDMMADEDRLLPLSDASRRGIALHTQFKHEAMKMSDKPAKPHNWSDTYRMMNSSWELGECERHQVAFRKALRESGQRSVDAFLGRSKHNRDLFGNLGKAATAYYLMRQEYLAACNRLLVRGWYRELFLRTFDWSGQPHPGLRVITFNYDVSLELALAMMNYKSYVHSHGEAHVGVSRVGIHHVYGHTDYAKMWNFYQQEKFERPLDVADEWNAELGLATAAAAKDIRIIDEKREGDDPNPPWKQWLVDAHEVVFLGFGFDETNLKTIGAHLDNQPWRDALESGLQVKATAYKLGKQGIANARALLGLRDDQGVFRDCDCETLLREESLISGWNPGKKWA